MERTNFSLRLLPSLLKSLQRIAEREDCSVNQLINIAVAEKTAVLDAEYWEERKRKARSNPPSDAWKNLAADEPPREGDEIPAGFKRRKVSAIAGKPQTLKAGG